MIEIDFDGIEAGRAGRDRNPADCILYFNFQDKKTAENLIRQNENTSMINHNLQELRRVVTYCQNKEDCRRCQILKYFSEVFNRDFCGVPMHQLCDNCSQPHDFEVVDVTNIAVELVRLRFHFSLFLNGSVRMQSAADHQHADFGRSRTSQRPEAARTGVCAVASLVWLCQRHLQA